MSFFHQIALGGTVQDVISTLDKILQSGYLIGGTGSIGMTQSIDRLLNRSSFVFLAYAAPTHSKALTVTFEFDDNAILGLNNAYSDLDWAEYCRTKNISVSNANQGHVNDISNWLKQTRLSVSDGIELYKNMFDQQHPLGNMRLGDKKREIKKFVNNGMKINSHTALNYLNSNIANAIRNSSDNIYLFHVEFFTQSSIPLNNIANVYINDEEGITDSSSGGVLRKFTDKEMSDIKTLLNNYSAKYPILASPLGCKELKESTINNFLSF